jgi:6-phosphogluconolactonase/glucosamine-6-phosphate isomerase/deaminase
MMEAATSFDRMVETLGLTPDQYVSSMPLKQWVLMNKDERYVPPDSRSVL